MRSVLAIEALSKRFGSTYAVSDLSISIEKGQVYGILGPNGSGKTTTLGMILGVIRPSAGVYRWFGEGASAKCRRRIGAILERPNFCPWLPAERNLQIVAAIRGVQDAKNLIPQVLQLVKLWDVRKLPFQSYSLGMKQRLAFAAALLGNPDVLVLDEPTNGVDAEGIAEIRDAITNVAQQGKTILLASHILDEVEKVCTHVAVLKKGRIIGQGAIDVVLAQNDVIEVAAENMEKLAQVLADLRADEPAIKGIERCPALFRVNVDENFSVAGMNARLFEKGIVASHLARHKRSLESHFLELLEKSQ